MPVVVREESVDRLGEYARISIAFDVVGRFDPETHSIEPVAEGWRKDYDAVDGAGPAAWPNRFDLTNWGVLAASLDGERVGGAVVTRDTPNMWMLEGRTDLAFLLDLRVDPVHRSSGIGRRLVEAVEEWAVAHGCIDLKVETQDINANACAFYQAVGFRLAEVDPNAYPSLPDETQVIWRKSLRPS